MKKLYCTFSVSFIALAAFLSSCSYNPGPTVVPIDTTHNSKLTFKKDFDARYDIFLVDTAKNGNNADHINLTDSVKKNIEEKIIDTTRSLTDKNGITKNHVAVIVTYTNPPGSSQDTNYFYQDPNGDLYRYNFGFSILNQFTYLTQAIGSNVDVGWVLAAKMASAEGTTWVARTDSVLIQSLGIWVYLSSQGQMMADTSFLVGTETIKARHSRNTVTATAAGGASTGGESGIVMIDSYYSAAINAVVEDFFRHVTLSGSLLKQQAQGKFKILTTHN